jgi:hypothetical protein
LKKKHTEVERVEVGSRVLRWKVRRLGPRLKVGRLEPRLKVKAEAEGQVEVQRNRSG